MSRLLIVGGNGVLGSAAATHFLNKDFAVTLLVRKKAKAELLEQKGASLLSGDLSDPATLKGIFKKDDIVLTAAHGMLGKGRNSSAAIDHKAHLTLVDEAKLAGVAHFIYTSAHNVSPDHPIDFYRNKYKVEQYLINSGLPYTILRLPAFMEWHAYRLLGKDILEKGKVTLLGKAANPTNFIAVKDVVSGLNIIAGNPQYFHKTITIGGPDNLSRNEVAMLFGKAAGIVPKIKHLPAGMVKALGVMISPFHPGIARVMKLALFTENSDETMGPETTVAQFGLEPTRMESFIESIIRDTGNGKSRMMTS